VCAFFLDRTPPKPVALVADAIRDYSTILAGTSGFPNHARAEPAFVFAEVTDNSPGWAVELTGDKIDLGSW
jgi:hypothetical protein